MKLALPGLTRVINRLPIPTLGRWTGLFGLAGLGIATISFGLLVALFIRAARATPIFAADDPFPTVVPNATPDPDFLAPTVPAWQGGNRVTVLLMGGDSRPGDGGNRPRTDTIIFMMIDRELQAAGMLSIPRDLYVDIPGYGLNRINTAYVYGGPDLAVETIEYNLGIPVDYYILVDFQVAITLVDEIGGIDLYVPKTIYDPRYPDNSYGYDPFYIEAGQQHLDGAAALKYARTRSGDNDYERARRQQAVLFAIRDKVVSAEILPTLVQRAPQLSGMLNENIRTNMTLEEIVALAYAVQEVERDRIRAGVIDANYVIDYETPQLALVEIPNRARIAELVEEVFWLK